jgi:hypothetical protein
MRTIPLFSNKTVSYTVPLTGGPIVKLTTRYNYVTRHWSLDIADAAGKLLVAGIALVPGNDLLFPYRQLKKTLGALVMEELFPEAHRRDDTLQSHCVLYWISPEEEAAYDSTL